ncbi:hypothetical protein MMC30_004124 [Trapelia coarctata]|nr:hypothetical protein [Trapelia coarctata]
MYTLSLFVGLLGLVAASKPGLKFGSQKHQGVATFNDYSKQGNTVCGPMAGSSGRYGAAAGDISPDISGGKCPGSIDMSLCDGQKPKSGYRAPQCPTRNCGLCYKVTNKGGYGGSRVGGVGNHIIVEIIDSCPNVHAANFCKTEVPKEERCNSHSTNQLDIDKSAYQALTGQAFGSGPNLIIEIIPHRCN